MTLAELLLQERERRARWRAVVLSEYEVTGSNQDRVRRWEVAQVVARVLGRRVIDNWFQQRLKALVESLGAESIQPRNKRFYRRLRRRATVA